MATNEDQPIDEIPLASNVDGATLLGVSDTGETRRFTVSAFKGDFKGTATVDTVPTPVLGQYYAATPGVTYPNFLDQSGVPIDIPLTISGETVLLAQMEWMGTYWKRVTRASALPAATNKIIHWTDGAYTIGSQVNHLGKDWESNANVVAGEIPGTSGKWVERLNVYTKAEVFSKTESNANLLAKIDKSSVVYLRDPDGQLFDQAEGTVVGYVSSSGTLSTGTVGYVYAVIPLADKGSNTQITLSGQTKPVTGIAKYWAYYNGATKLTFGVANATPGTPLVLAIPTGATVLYLTTRIPDDAAGNMDTLMVNYGNVAKPLVPYSKTVSGVAGVPIKNADKEIYSKSEVYSKTENYAKTEVYNKTEVDSKVATFQKIDQNLNRYNPTEMLVTGLVASGASIGLSNAAGWKMAWRVPLSADVATIYFSGWNSTRREVAFFNGVMPPKEAVPGASFDAQWLSKSTPTKTDGKASVTKPVGATWMAINIASSSEAATVYEQFQISFNVQLNTYYPYDEAKKSVSQINSTKVAASTLIDSEGLIYSVDSVLNKNPELTDMRVSITGSEDVNLEYVINGNAIKETLRVFRSVTPDLSAVFDWKLFYLNGVQVRSTGDDAAPYRIMDGTIGSNHGWGKTRIDFTSHGKQNVDVGSIWRDPDNSNKEWVIVGIRDVNSFDITSRIDNSTFTGNTLIHVSGATNTSNITAGTKTANQMYPAIKNRKIEMVVDGYKVTDTVTPRALTARSEVTFNESYEIMSKSSIVEWLITQVGTTTKISEFNGTAVASVGLSYVFNKKAGCTLYTEITALENIAALQDIMFVMAVELSGTFNYYVPTSLPLTFQSVNYNFTNPTDLAAVVMASRLDFTPSKIKATGLYGDRVLMLKNDIGIALGYLPVQDTAIDVRRSRAARKAIQISDSRKVYMSAIDSAAITSMPKGTTYGTIAYKNYFLIESSRTALYSVKAKDATYVYMDWHTFGIDRVPMPLECAGKAFVVVEKTDNVTILSKNATSSLLVEVANTSNYGYLILKFAQ